MALSNTVQRIGALASGRVIGRGCPTSPLGQIAMLFVAGSGFLLPLVLDRRGGVEWRSSCCLQHEVLAPQHVWGGHQFDG